MSTSTSTKLPIVLVHWVDPCRGEYGWIERETFEPAVAECYTVGFLYVDDDPITVVGSLQDESYIGEVFTIPRSCVKSVTYLAAV